MVQGSCWFVGRDWVYYQCIKGSSYLVQVTVRKGTTSWRRLAFLNFLPHTNIMHDQLPNRSSRRSAAVCPLMPLFSRRNKENSRGRTNVPRSRGPVGTRQQRLCMHCCRGTQTDDGVGTNAGQRPTIVKSYSSSLSLNVTQTIDSCLYHHTRRHHYTQIGTSWKILSVSLSFCYWLVVVVDSSARTFNRFALASR
jgi:hypothetical protein